MRERDAYRPVSIRFLVPAIEAAMGVDGRAVDFLHRCYGTFVEIDGCRVPAEYYFTDYQFYTNNIHPQVVWDMPEEEWKSCCNVTWPVTGTNPCEVHGVGHEVRPIPVGWAFPQVRVSDDKVLSVGGGQVLWWY